MARIARDEALHLNAVMKLLFSRGGKLERGHRSLYAQELRKLVRRGSGDRELLDRLLVSALIEARSAERFEVLSRCCKERDLAKFYASLWTSEVSHYKSFIRLARTVRPKREVEARWQLFLDKEANIIASQPPGPHLHSGIAD